MNWRLAARSTLAFTMVAAIGCGGSNGGNGSGGGTGSGGGGGTGGGSGSAGGGGLSAAGPYTLQFGPITVAPTLEDTQCLVLRLHNANAIHVGSIHNVLGDSSHHMIVYRVDDTVEQTTPFDCQPFTETLNPAKGQPLMITQKHDETLTLPDGVAFTLDANQMIRIEMHYINATMAPVTLTSTATFTETTNFVNEAGFLFMGDIDISLPPQVATTVGPVFAQLDPAYNDVNFFALTGHEHKMGTNVTINVSSSASDPGTSVYNVPNWIWSEPATVYQTPTFKVPAGGGFTYQCDWFNSDPAITAGAPTPNITFGESANNEMCFFWAYYYPSVGAKVCLHSSKFGDVCCPDANNATSSQICAFLGGS
jgi:hypothetical protein